jgi:hypothetical protein
MKTALTTLLSILLAACGGGDPGDDTKSTQPVDCKQLAHPCT